VRGAASRDCQAGVRLFWCRQSIILLRRNLRGRRIRFGVYGSLFRQKRAVVALIGHVINPAIAFSDSISPGHAIPSTTSTKPCIKKRAQKPRHSTKNSVQFRTNAWPGPSCSGDTRQTHQTDPSRLGGGPLRARAFLSPETGQSEQSSMLNAEFNFIALFAASSGQPCWGCRFANVPLSRHASCTRQPVLSQLSPGVFRKPSRPASSPKIASRRPCDS
jgi:hypothetical protein